MIILSGDVGGTTTRMQVVDFADSGEKNIIKKALYKSADYAGFTDILDDFFSDSKSIRNDIARACFGVAGPVANQTAALTNLPWIIKCDDIKNKLGLNEITLINDFVAIGYGLGALKPEDLLTLTAGKPDIQGIKAYMGAGTGLGIGFVVYDSKGSSRVYPTEGGHADFAPTDDLQLELLMFLRKKYHRVSLERVLSGQGLVNIYQFVSDSEESKGKENAALKALINSNQSVDLPAAITEYALNYHDPIATKALNIFVSIYGAAAGNLALTTLPFGGLYLVGGIIPKILPLVKNHAFLTTFFDKGRMTDLVKDISVHAVLYPDIGLQGAALYAKTLNYSAIDNDFGR
ncbi:MAG: glucokinase [Gammaproteobacteria bacterium]|nr:glucokinase [Gammaproteobacteria bacterium]